MRQKLIALSEDTYRRLKEIRIDSFDRTVSIMLDQVELDMIKIPKEVK